MDCEKLILLKCVFYHCCYDVKKEKTLSMNHTLALWIPNLRNLFPE